MIRVMLYDPRSEALTSGGEELLAAWHGDANTRMGVDLAGNSAERDREILVTHLDLHPLAVQDALRDRHPPKIEAFDRYTFVLLKGLHAVSESTEFRTIQLAFFVGERFLVTRHSDDSPSVDQVWRQVQSDPSLLGGGADLVALRVMRTVVKRYVAIVLHLEPRLDQMEDEMVQRPNDALLAELLGYKSDLKKLRRVFAYHQQIFAALRLERFPGVSEDRQHELNDLFEHQERAGSLTQLYYELASDLIDGYISLAAHHLNSIMKTLTIVASIFIPLTFIAGIYGMNFENMPELKAPEGYFLVLVVMALIATVLIVFFRRRRWL
jgi:magnesium transporter